MHSFSGPPCSTLAGIRVLNFFPMAGREGAGLGTSYRDWRNRSQDVYFCSSTHMGAPTRNTAGQIIRKL
jgi:hypothetical protein